MTLVPCRLGPGRLILAAQSTEDACESTIKGTHRRGTTMTDLKAGMRLRCVNGDTEIIIISPPEPGIVITCHGEPMVPKEA